MSKRKTTAEFIQDAIIVHGTKYDYSKSVYVKSTEKLMIICVAHGEFYIRPNDHINSQQGCYHCGRISKIITTEEFKQKALTVHGDEYDYSKTVYVRAQIPLTITCKIHGDFFQKPNDHISGKTKCPACVDNQLTTQDFIARSQQVHGQQYDYSKVKYVRDSGLVTIICRVHGEFQQSYQGHKRQAQGCPSCVSTHYSTSSIDWLTYISNRDHVDIQHAMHIGEFRIPHTKFKADGYCADTNTVYEFLGDYWHGNPEMYASNHYIQVCNKTAGELYQKTIDRAEKIRSLGYNLVEIWESDWNKIKKHLT